MDDRGKKVVTESLGEFFVEQVERQGVAVAQVKDGHVFLIKRAMLQDILAKNPDAPEVMIFIKHNPGST